MKTLHSEFKEKLVEISNLSSKIDNNDNTKILRLIKEHIEEIEELYYDNDEHWTVETADLIVLCYELLILKNKDIDEVFKKCLPRFDVKLNELLKTIK